MLQETADEFLCLQCFLVPFPLVILVFEGDFAVFEVDDAFVADGNSKDVARQVFQGFVALSDRLDVDDPVGAPDFLRHLLEHLGMLLERIAG